MPYRFATESTDYSDYTSGRVFYGLPGCPAFPVRLASEIFQRCAEVLRADNDSGPYTIYDPCCGGAYHLSTLAFLHWREIREIVGSDIDGDALGLARRNLSLLTLDGLDGRIAEIAGMLESYGKSSHRAALASARGFRTRLEKLSMSHVVRTRVFQANALDADDLFAGLGSQAIDIVLTDIPYGQRSGWVGAGVVSDSDAPPAVQMLEALWQVLSPTTVVAVASDKGQRIQHPSYDRIERFRMGKRQIVMLRTMSG